MKYPFPPALRVALALLTSTVGLHADVSQVLLDVGKLGVAADFYTPAQTLVPMETVIITPYDEVELTESYLRFTFLHDEYNQGPLTVTCGNMERTAAFPQNGVVDLRTGAWTATDNAPRQLFLVPPARAGHALMLFQPGGSGQPPIGTPVTLGDTEQTAVSPHGWWNYLSAWASYDPAKPFWLVDLSTNPPKASVQNATDTVWTSWTNYFGPLPVREVTVELPLNDATRQFVLRQEGGATQAIRAQEAGSFDNDGHWQSAGYSLLSVAVAVHRYFWLERQDDLLLSPRVWMGHANVALDWKDADDPFPDLGPITRTWVSKSFMLPVTRSGHHFAVIHADGLRVATPPISETFSLENWDDFGVANHFYYNPSAADVDDDQDWWVRDETANEDFPIRQTAIFDGWVPAHPAPPGESVALMINAGRVGHALRFAPNSSLAEDWPVAIGEWGTPITGTDTYDSFSIQFAHATAPGPQSSGNALRDNTTGESYSADASLWFPPTVPLILNISATRWNHTFSFVQPIRGGSSVQRGSIQGDWVLSGGQAYFTGYGYFDLATTYEPQLAWRLFDVTAGEEVASVSNGGSTDLTGWTSGDTNTDTDMDGLPDWYEVIIGTNPDAADTDQDGMNDYAELQALRSPTSAPPVITVTGPPGAIYQAN